MLTIQDLVFANIAAECAFCGKSLDCSDIEDSRYENTHAWSHFVAERAEQEGWGVLDNNLYCEKCYVKSKGKL
jgi:hypothetical protein